MNTTPSRADVKDVAKWLKTRKENAQHPILLLGARTGGLFRSKNLYATSQLYSPRTFQNMTQPQQFGECYRVLCESGFTRSDINSILIPSLQSLKTVQADIYLADLIRSGIFELIFSTNIDNLLPDAFEVAGMQDKKDFQVLNPYQNSPDEITSYHLKQLYTLIKISGDLAIGEYNLFKQHFYLETHDMLRTFLTNMLSHAVLMLGYDPFWDRAVEALFPLGGDEFWYVNEEMPKTPFSTIQQSRKGRYVVGSEGSYQYFMQNLHWHLDDERSLHDLMLPNPWQENIYSLSISTESQSQNAAIPSSENHQTKAHAELRNEKSLRTCIYIVCCQRDHRYLNRLKAHIADYERKNLLNVWDDQKVKPGSNYRQELERTLSVTKVAILLTSADFYKSDIIANDILPSLMHMADQGVAVLLPIIIHPHVFEGTVLQRFQPFNDPSKPLSLQPAGGKEKVWADLVRYLITLGKDF